MSRPQVILALTIVAMLTACKDDDICERCDYIFDWSGDGQLSNTIKNCEEIECDENLCGLCVNIEYNLLGLPVTGTCYSCPANLVPECPAELDQCEDYMGRRCVDLQIDPLHCGSCDSSCGENEECIDGDCVDRPL